MRLWTVHPKYLDSKGLVALWREGLLAKAVLEGKTKGYVNHPQLIRFRSHNHPIESVCEYLYAVHSESKERGYNFDETKLPSHRRNVRTIEETIGQIEYEWKHLLAKLKSRAPERYTRLSGHKGIPDQHPLFVIGPGKIREWERVA
jgi:hypothetical protein